MREPKLFGEALLPTGLVGESPTHIAVARPLAFAWYADGVVHIDTVDKCDAEDLALRSLSALLSLIPAEQVVQAMGEETRQKFLEHFADAILGKHCGPLTMVQALRDERDEALARAEKAEADAAASWQFAELARIKAKEAGDRAFSASERANSAERERDAMHAAAEELRAQGAELGEDCERCNGTGRKTEESDGKSSAQVGAEQVEVTDAPMRMAEHVAAIGGQPEAGDLQALHRADASKRFKKLASAIVLSVAESDPGDPATDLVVHHDKLRAIIVEALENEVHADAPVPSEAGQDSVAITRTTGFDFQTPSKSSSPQAVPNDQARQV